MLAQCTTTKIITDQRSFFNTNKTKNIAFRLEQLNLLKKAILDNEPALIQALKADLNKPELEAYTSEISFCLAEIKYALNHLKNWLKPQKVTTPLPYLPASSKIYFEPLGVVLIIGAWNYPLQLVIAPLVGAIAAGNCAVLKPSELAANTSNLLAEIIPKYFDSSLISVVEGGKEITQQLLAEKFDHIFLQAVLKSEKRS